MTDPFDRLVETLIGKEGGYVNDPKDSGGETIWGITVAVARENGYSGPMRNMTRDQAKAIYRAKYWAKPGLYLIAPMSERVAEELLDTGVNAGTGTAGMFFQRALNVLNRGGADYADIKVDGAIGPATAKAYASYRKRNGALAEERMLKALNCMQGNYYIELAEARSKDERFVNGWLDQRVHL